MNLYRNSILFFGVILPVIGGLALLAAGYIFKVKCKENYSQNITGYNSSQTDRLASLSIEGKLLGQRAPMERWSKILNAETASTVRSELGEILIKVNPDELQQTSFIPSSSKIGLGTAAGQNSSQVQILFRGTFRAMQRVFLELETRLPNLQMQDLKIDRNSTQPKLLNFQVTYTAWEK